MAPALTPQQDKLTSSSPLALYKELSVGTNGSVLDLVLYELFITILSPLPGLLGFGLRSIFSKFLFKKTGRAPALGRQITLRQPAACSLGDKVMIDDFAVLDVRGEGSITIGDKVSIGRFTTVTAKYGQIHLESGANIGSYCRIATQSKVEIGESTLVAAYCYIGPGNHKHGDGEDDKPMIAREMDIKGGVKIGKHCWIGTRATILDGVTIGDGSVVGAHALVLEDVPAGVVVAGVPAKVIKTL